MSMEVDYLICRKNKEFNWTTPSKKIVVDLIPLNLEEHPLSSGFLPNVKEQIDE